VVDKGHAIFTERMIVGKADTQTPVFSDQMDFLVFHPFWGVPDSIKMKEILPGLARGNPGVLAKNNLRIQYRGRDIDPGSVDWSSTDIRNFHVYQPPGGGNVLGQVKFMFPNKHQVYMHDTPTKNLFNSSQRTFSHGCMRVRNPLRFAEVLLERDKGWNGARIASLIKGGQQDNNVKLDSKIPVHITYFTAWVNDDGKLSTYADIYGHEPKIQMGIEGKAHLIVKKKEELSPVRADAVGRLAETRNGGASSGGAPFSAKNMPDWARKVLGN
jgi:murein L,D-transpeptidase YcbB/YkuD